MAAVPFVVTLSMSAVTDCAAEADAACLYTVGVYVLTWTLVNPGSMTSGAES